NEDHSISSPALNLMMGAFASTWPLLLISFTFFLITASSLLTSLPGHLLFLAPCSMDTNLGYAAKRCHAGLLVISVGERPAFSASSSSAIANASLCSSARTRADPSRAEGSSDRDRIPDLR